MTDDDEAQEIATIVATLRPEMETPGMKYDPALIRDVIRIVRAVGVAEGGNPRLDASRLD